MFSSIATIVIASCIGLASAAAVFSINAIIRKVPDEDREYKDQLPLFLRLIWPLINFVAFNVGEYLSVEYIERQKKILQRSELIYLMSPEQFFGLQVVSAFFFGAIAWMIFALLSSPSLLIILLIAAFGFIFPFISLNDRLKKREKRIIRALPVFLDYITMALLSGLNLNGALLQAVEKGPDGPLKREFQNVLRDIRAGMPRLDTFRAMADRVNLKEITSLITAIAQAERTGSSLGETLKIQAEQRRIERFQRAEKLALEAPVKLIFPLVAFIFPTTFLILAFPIIMKFMYEL